MTGGSGSTYTARIPLPYVSDGEVDLTRMSGLPHEHVGEFIDAVVEHPAKADAMLAQRPELLDARWIHDETVLHFLAIEGFTEAVRFLAVRGADVNAVNEFGDTALVDIAGLGLTDIVDILLSHGANPDAQSAVRDNPLHAAARAGHAELVRRLLKAGANAQYRTDLGETIFDAVNENPSEERQELLAVLADYDVRSRETE